MAATGIASCVGMLGATLGAGVGTLQGLHGLSLDALESVSLVTATGDLLEVSSTQNWDLFWALRGAGANFGIVTSATYKTYNATNGGMAITADFIYEPSQNVTIWEYLKSFDDDTLLPPELSLIFVAEYNRTASQVCEVSTKQKGGNRELIAISFNSHISLTS
jgi:fumiquinazoline A oxidase